MKALSWDDEPKKYLEKLQPHLADYDIHLEIESNVGVFLTRLTKEKWSFVITDLFSPVAPGSQEDSSTEGVRLANVASERNLPVFVITKEFDRAVAEAAVPPSAIVKSKSTHAAWMAYEIVRDLRRLGIPVNSRRVFIVYGHDKKTQGATEKLTAFLRGLGLEVDAISGVNLKTEILSGLLERMNECAAFVAVCTPDDQWKDGSRHPRQNVLVEIGIALGLSRGLHRLTILQRTGPEDDKALNAMLPSDLEGIVTMRFANRIEEVFDDLPTRLRELGLDIKADAED